ncbi:MAG: LysR family transcriptional regulator [Peptococcaceae bacterium]|nr:LysR family transcriptional regulator [Peptococcaceae bacterium]
MRIEQLEHFIAICEEGTFIKASDKLHMAQQTLSNSIKNLESTLNTQLFIRSNKGVELTYKGEIAYKYFKEIMMTYTAFINEISESTEIADEINVRISSIPFIALNHIPEFQCAMLLGHPNINLSIQSEEIENIPHSVENNSVDIGLLVGQYLADELIFPKLDGALNILPLREWQLYVWVGENCSLYKKNSIHISTISKYPVLLYEPRQEKLIKNTLDTFLDDELSIKQYDNIRTIANLVESTSQLFFDWHNSDYGLDYQIYFAGKKAKAIPVVLDEPITMKSLAIYKDAYKVHPSFHDVIALLKSTSK